MTSAQTTSSSTSDCGRAPLIATTLQFGLDIEYSNLCHSVATESAKFLGPLDHNLVQSAYAAASVHVLASFGETPGLVNLEAAAQGCPIVVSDRGAERDYFGDGAIYCDPLDPSSIRAAVGRAIGEGRCQRVRSLQGEVASRYTWQAVAKQMKGVYQELMI